MKYAIEPYELMVYQNVELMDENDKLKTENDKLRELVSKYAAMTEYLLARQPLLFPDKASELQSLDEKRQELGIEVDG